MHCAARRVRGREEGCGSHGGNPHPGTRGFLSQTFMTITQQLFSGRDLCIAIFLDGFSKSKFLTPAEFLAPRLASVRGRLRSQQDCSPLPHLRCASPSPASTLVQESASSVRVKVGWVSAGPGHATPRGTVLMREPPPPCDHHRALQGYLLRKKQPPWTVSMALRWP